MRATLKQFLRQLYRERGRYYNLAWTSSEFLHWLVGLHKPKRILEIGGANGFSAIWMADALKENRIPGKIFSIEYNPEKFELARHNIRQTGFHSLVKNEPGDAFETIPKLKGKFDLVFLDAWKNDYLPLFQLFFPKLEPGGLIVADNAIGLADEMADYLQAVRSHPKLESILVPLGDGLEVSRKKSGEKK